MAQPTPTEWQSLGPAGADGCFAVDGVSPTYGVAQGSRMIEGSAGPDGLVTLDLPARRISVIDRDGALVDTPVRYLTDDWRDLVPVEGERTISSELAPQHIEVTLDGARLVLDFTGDDLTVQLSTILADSGLELVEVNRGDKWVPLANGGELLPGRMAVRLNDGTVAKIEVPAASEVLVPSGTVRPLP